MITEPDDTHRVLFICGKNQWRSPTAEHIFADHPGLACASAGLSKDSEVQVSADLLAWADTVFVMEKAHKTRLTAGFKAHLHGKRVVCLEIKDRYPYMDPELVRLLLARVTPYLPG